MSAHLPAFPVQPIGSQGLPVCEASHGLTKRELIAAMAMQGVLPNSARDFAATDLAEFATEHADALLAHLAKDGAQ